MAKLKGNENFLCINQAVNIFDIISCKEEQASDIIAWLLNPRESHQLGFEFFEAFLHAFSSENGRVCGYQYDGTQQVRKVWKSVSTLINAYADVVIQTEYYLDKDSRVDILLCLEDVKCLFVIENKYGAKEHNEQTQRYFKHFSRARYKDYIIFYVYMDIWNLYKNGNKKLSDPEHWHIIDYNWVINSLKKYKSRPSKVSKILHDIYIEFSANYEEEEYFKPFFDNKIKLAKKYEDFEGVDHYDILKKDKDVDAFNYCVFYDMLNNISFWEKYIPIDDNNIYCCGKKLFKCDVRDKSMYLTPLTISQKYDNYIQDKENARQIHWPINCCLKNQDNLIDICLEFPDSGLKYLIDHVSLKQELEKINEEIGNMNSSLKNLPQTLDVFLKKCSKVFKLVAQATYNQKGK